MLYPVCPTCGEFLSNKELIYENEMKNICESLEINDEIISQGNLEKNQHYIKKKQHIINKLVSKPCCKMRLMNYLDLVKIII